MKKNSDVWSEILSQVERPSRYLGTEWNAVHKDLKEIKLRIALVFPDLYELGLGNLGLHILYSILNKHPFIWAERVYAPAPDMEAILRQKNQPLFLWESKDPVRVCNLVGFTLQTELTYTTILNILDLSHIPIYSKDRTDEDPLICAGGPCCYNPEPLSPFIDFFVIGEGEEAILNIAETLLAKSHLPRQKKLELLSEIEGVYVPGTIALVPNQRGIPVPDINHKKIRRVITKQLTTENFISEYIVPYTQLVHDGLSIEVMRGCARGCRFCLAGCVYRPVRERSPQDVKGLLSKLLSNTGLESVSLVSLATCDHSRVQELLRETREITQSSMTGISLPSLRLDSFSVMLADSISSIRRSGLTFAPEAGSERLRKVINKSVTDEELIEIVRIAFQKGWTHIKLYFMIGLPTETEEDLDSIINLSIHCLEIAKKIRSSAHIHLGISTFVPKPWTPFQWDRQISLEQTVEKQKKILRGLRRYKAIKINFHTPESSFIEGIISRGDRRISKVIFSAWSLGAKLETSSDKICISHWMQALEENSLSWEEFLQSRDTSEMLPWDFIDPGIKKEWLLKEREKAFEYSFTPDCRETHCHQCGIQLREGIHCIRWKNEKEKDVVTPSATLPAQHSVSVPQQRLLLKIGKVGPVRFLSHLEFQTAWIRAFRRAQLPVVYSQGYHAHARISIALPSPVGETLLEEYMETWFHKEMDTKEIVERLSTSIPEGFLLHNVESIPLSSPSLMERVAGLQYAVIIENDEALQEEVIKRLTSFFQTHIEKFFSNTQRTPQPLSNYFVIKEENDKKILLQWLTPVVRGTFFKPKFIKEYLHQEGYPLHTSHSIRLHTFLDTLPSNIDYPKIEQIVEKTNL